MIPKDKIEYLINRYSKLESELSLGSIDKKDYAVKSKEYSDLSSVINVARQYLNFESEKTGIENIINDKKSDIEIKDLAKIELKNIIDIKEKNEKILKLYLIPKDLADQKNAILEIRAGTGGLEASLFAADLFKMYEKVSIKKNGQWKLLMFQKVKRED